MGYWVTTLGFIYVVAMLLVTCIDSCRSRQPESGSVNFRISHSVNAQGRRSRVPVADTQPPDASSFTFPSVRASAQQSSFSGSIGSMQ